MKKNINFANPKSQYIAQKSDIKSAINNVLNSNVYIGGKIIDKFELNFSKLIKSKYSISCKSGTDAIFLALKACGVKDNDEVIVPSHTAVATATAVKMLKAKPVFADIDEYFTIDINHIKKLYNKKTKAIIAVHLYGQSCDIQNIVKFAKKKNIKVIEDCAQAIGTYYKYKHVGTFGDCGCFSFYPTKNLGAIGDGGCVVTNSVKINDYIKTFKNYGWKDQDIIISGVNSRLDTLQASILNVKLKNLKANNLKRNIIAKNYMRELCELNLELPKLRKKSVHSFHLFVILVKNRQKFLKFLRLNNIIAGIHYLKPIHKLNNFKSNYEISETDRICKYIVSLPIYPELSKDDQIYIIKIIKKFFKK
jgi:dTDP-4-amino-4,6-dideoxygalactose transaminase